LEQNYKKKIIFWLSADLTHFCLANYLQKKGNFDFFAIYDVTNKPRKFFETQTLVNFKQIWFYHDYVLPDKKYDFKKIDHYEKKFDLNIKQLIENDRFFNDYNDFYKFSKDEILSIIEKEFTFFESVLDEKPDFFITSETYLRAHHVFFLMCKKLGIKIIMLNHSNWGDYYFLSNNYRLLSNFKKIFQETMIHDTSFLELQTRLEQMKISKKLSKFYESKNSLSERIKAGVNLLLHSDDSLIKTHYTYFGRTKIKILKSEFFFIFKKFFREKFINKNFSLNIKNDRPFIYFPLQQEPERSLLLSAPDFSDQINNIQLILENLPENYLLYVKEHPTQGPGRGWRSIDKYRKILSFKKLKLIHPSVDSSELIKNSKLVISISGSTVFEAAFFNKPSMTFVESDFSLIPSISKFNSSLPLKQQIIESIEKKPNPGLITNYIDIIEKKSFIFEHNKFEIDYGKTFYFDSNLVDVEISEDKMKKFLFEQKEILENLANHYLIYMKNHDDAKHV
tara:strand:+ start:2787 stop:4310 length:1524 start_codon:yes stop_codon:yes gene_type:complete